MNCLAPRLGRRCLPRLLAGGALALAPRAARAGRGWCRVDPVVRVDGQTCHITAAADVPNRPQARDLSTGPIRVAVAVPTGARFEHVASDDGFGYGYAVTSAEDGKLPAGAVEVAIYVPMTDGAVPIRAWFDARGNGPHAGTVAEGTANAWLIFRATAGGQDCRGNGQGCRSEGPEVRSWGLSTVPPTPS